MAVTVQEQVREQSAGLTRNGWQMSRVWLVTLESIAFAASAAIEAVTNDPDGAAIGDGHPVNPYIFLVDLSPEPAGDNRLVWTVTGSYQAVTLTGVESAQSPLDEPKTLSWGFATRTEVVETDKDGNQVVNSAGQPFDPPLTQEISALTATIKQNLQEYFPAQAADVQGAVNSNAATIGNLTVFPRMAKIIERSAEIQYWEQEVYYAVTTRVEIRIQLDTSTSPPAVGFDRVVLDIGLYGTDDNGDFGLLKTEKGEDATEPLKLNGNGEKLTPQDSAGVFLPFRINKERDFGPLNLETD